MLLSGLFRTSKKATSPHSIFCTYPLGYSIMQNSPSPSRKRCWQARWVNDFNPKVKWLTFELSRPCLPETHVTPVALTPLPLAQARPRQPVRRQSRPWTGPCSHATHRQAVQSGLSPTAATLTEKHTETSRSAVSGGGSDLSIDGCNACARHRQVRIKGGIATGSNVHHGGHGGRHANIHGVRHSEI